MGNVLLSSITFLAAFLLFAIELVMAKIFLPAYGGSYLVWGASIVFFQAVLLLGYWFSHRFIARLGLTRYRYLHLALLLVPLAFFPGRGLGGVQADPSVPLVVDVFLRLALSIGPVFFVLSTMSITTQMWLSRSNLQARLNPYALYAVSNLGSFAGLLSYPFFVELYLEIPQQIALWRTLYFVLIALNAIVFLAVPVKEAAVEAKVSGPIERAKLVRWMLLGAGGSMAFLSVNNMITYELPPVPLFWIFPLSIYLLSFVLNFKRTPWCPQWIARFIAPILGLSALFYFFIQKYNLPPLVEFLSLLGILFVLCMYCQNELIRSKPREDWELTRFYFLISAGSFLGGILTTWMIPLISNSMVEYLCALAVVAFSFSFDQSKEGFSARALRIVVYLNLLYFLWSAVFIRFNPWAVVFLFAVSWATYVFLARSRYGVVVMLSVLALTVPVQEKMWDRKATDSSYKIRNYYGVHQIVDSQGIRWLYHGRTLHGAQFLSPEMRLKPITYYGIHSGVWDVATLGLFRFSNIALIGLGAGIMSVYSHGGQTLDIFELDPDVYKIAKEKFSFLRSTQAAKRVFLGDARRMIKKINDRKYDLLMIDAFGGDTIPVHLLTKDVFKEYRTHLTESGIIVIHVSNRYIDLVPVLAKVAQALGAKICYKESVIEGWYYNGSYWIFITWDREAFARMVSRPNWVDVSGRPFPGRVWSDEYSTILPAMRWGYLLESMKRFWIL